MSKYGITLKKEVARCGACLSPFLGKQVSNVCPVCGKEVTWENFPVMQVPFVPVSAAEWDMETDFPERFNLKKKANGKYVVSIPSDYRESVESTVRRIAGVPENESSMTDIECEIIKVTRKAPYMALAGISLKTVSATAKKTYATEIHLYLADESILPYVVSIKEVA
jgi:hypothetical protein